MTIQGSNVVVKGSGTLDGNGQVYWNGGHTGGPKMVRFSLTGSSSVSGITVKNSPAQHISLKNNAGTTFDNIKILIDRSRLSGSAEAKNTDGFDIGDCTGVTIRNCNVDNEDDCVAINGGTSTGVKDLLIEGLTCRNGHGISIGSLGSNNAQDIVDGLTVRNTQFYNVKYAARIKSYLVSSNSGHAKNIKYIGITVHSASKPAVCITQHYCNNGNCGSGTTAFPISASFQNFTFASGSYYEPVVNFACQSSSACGPFTFSSPFSLPSGGKVACSNTGSLSGIQCTSGESVTDCN